MHAQHPRSMPSLRAGGLLGASSGNHPEAARFHTRRRSTKIPPTLARALRLAPRPTDLLMQARVTARKRESRTALAVSKRHDNDEHPEFQRPSTPNPRSTFGPMGAAAQIRMHPSSEVARRRNVSARPRQSNDVPQTLSSNNRRNPRRPAETRRLPADVGLGWPSFHQNRVVLAPFHPCRPAIRPTSVKQSGALRQHHYLGVVFSWVRLGGQH